MQVQNAKNHMINMLAQVAETHTMAKQYIDAALTGQATAFQNELDSRLSVTSLDVEALQTMQTTLRGILDAADQAADGEFDIAAVISSVLAKAELNKQDLISVNAGIVSLTDSLTAEIAARTTQGNNLSSAIGTLRSDMEAADTAINLTLADLEARMVVVENRSVETANAFNAFAGEIAAAATSMSTRVATIYGLTPPSPVTDTGSTVL